MAENDERPEVPPDAAPDEPTAAQPVIPAEPAVAPVLKTRWRDRAWTFRAMIAVAAASVLVGGVAGGAIVAASGDDHDRDHYRMGPWGPGGQMQMPPGWRGPKQFRDGGPRWRWDDNDMMPDQGGLPGTPNPPTPSPSAGSTG
jgi:hypothetical protein